LTSCSVWRRLAALGLVDPGYSNGPTNEPPIIWVSNPNGKRVLRHIETSPELAARLESKVTVSPRARTALTSLSETDQLAVWSAVEALQGRVPTSWPREELWSLSPNKQEYLLRVSPDLRAFIRVLDSGAIELFDLVREEALQLFLERQPSGAARP
jgi:hypothetical protein